MPTSISPQTLQRAVQSGFKRLTNFRKARLLFMRQYAGPYYDRDYGLIATEPLNLIFNAIRVLVPNLVMNFPKHKVRSEIAAYRDYGDMLALALDVQGRDMNIRDIYRRWIVDSLFCMGILKTGLCESGSVIHWNEDDQIDPGSVYTEVVDLDDYTFDPAARQLEEAAFAGDTIRVPRVQLLDSGLYKNDLLERVPSATGMNNARDNSDQMSRTRVTEWEADELHDSIDVVELWVPRANAIVTVPRVDMNLSDYLRISEYYGPDEGPYTYLKLTPPLPNNPMPVAPVGIWADLHIMANRMAHKIMQQAERQKDLVGYKRSAADDAQEVVDARDGEAVAMEDPESVRMFNFGGQQQSNEAHMAQLQMWFNLMSGNTEALGGIRSDAGTATQAEILQQNGAVGMEDMRDIVYAGGASEVKKRAWYLHTDPLIEIPLIKRTQVPAKFSQGQPELGISPQLMEPARMEDRQIVLTPEARRGDFLDFTYEIQIRSMSRLDPQMQTRNTMEFLTKAVPAAVQASMMSAQMGVGLSFPKLLIRMARDQYGLEWFDEIFFDEEFQQQIAQIMMQSPGIQGSKGTATQTNGQPASAPKIQSPSQQSNSQAQYGAVPRQEAMRTNTMV